MPPPPPPLCTAFAISTCQCSQTAPPACHARSQIGADRHLLNNPSVQRLQHGLLWFALLAVVLHLVHLLFVKTLTLWGLLIGGC